MSTMVLLLSVALLAWAPISGGRQTDPPQPSVELPPELARVLRDYEAAWRGRDPAALSRLFTEDGFVLPQGRPPVRGRAAIERYYTGQGGPLSLRAIAFAAEGGWGTSSGDTRGIGGRRTLGSSR